MDGGAGAVSKTVLGIPGGHRTGNTGSEGPDADAELLPRQRRRARTKRTTGSPVTMPRSRPAAWPPARGGGCRRGPFARRAAAHRTPWLRRPPGWLPGSRRPLATPSQSCVRPATRRWAAGGTWAACAARKSATQPAARAEHLQHFMRGRTTPIIDTSDRPGWNASASCLRRREPARAQPTPPTTDSCAARAAKHGLKLERSAGSLSSHASLSVERHPLLASTGRVRKRRATRGA